jgi:hypothetical protein
MLTTTLDGTELCHQRIGCNKLQSESEKVEFKRVKNCIYLSPVPIWSSKFGIHCSLLLHFLLFR